MENRIVNVATSVVSQQYSLTELSPEDVRDPVSPRKRSRESEDAFENDEQKKGMLVQVERNVDKAFCISQVGMSIEASDIGLLNVAVKGLIQNDSTTKFGDQDFLVQVNLHSCYQYDFDRIRVAFGNLIETVAPLIETGIPSLKNLQKFLQRCFQELKPQLDNAESFDDVMDLIQDKCSVVNVCCLEAIVDRYNIALARLPIKDFKTTVDTFCEKFKDEVCCNESFTMISPSKYVTYETIVFFLEWEVDKYTLKDIRSLLSKAFKDIAKSVVVKAINDNSSITLLVLTKENFHLLKEMGLIKGTIGNRTTFEKDKRDDLKETQWDAEDFKRKWNSGNLLIREILTDWLRQNEAIGIIKMISCEEQ